MADGVAGSIKNKAAEKKMKNLRNLVATFLMVTFLAAGTTFAGDGILVSNRDGILVSNRAERNTKQPCRASTKINAGILVSNIVGILVSNFTGILVSNAVGTVSCDQKEGGILVSN